MRLAIILLLLCRALPLHAQPPDALAAARLAASAFIDAATNPRATLLPGMITTALGCQLVQGLPLAMPLDAWRFDFPTPAGDFAVHASVDGRLTQLCDQRVPNPGFGPIPLARQNTNSAPDSDACWLRAASDGLNVRIAPMEDVAARLDRLQKHEALGRNESGDWLFFRQGWVKRSLLRLSGDCDNLPIIDPRHAASGVIHFCPVNYAGFLPPRIDVGRRAARSASHTFANRLRANPNPAAEQIGEIPPRSILDAVLDGPACQGTYVWWQVEVDGLVGWTIESDRSANFYYLEPYAKPSLRPMTPADQARTPTMQPIESPAANIDTVALLDVDSPRAVAISPDGTLLAVAGGHGISFYSLPDFAPHDMNAAWLHHPIDALAFSNDGQRLATISGRELHARSLDSGELTLHDRFPYPLRNAAFSRDDNFLAVAGMNPRNQRAAIWVYDSAGEVALSMPLVAAGLPPYVAASQHNDSDFVFGSADKLYRLSMRDGVARPTYQQAGMKLRALAFSPGEDSSLLALALDDGGVGWIALVDAIDPDAPGKTLRLDAHDLTFSPDGSFLAAIAADRVYVLGTVE